MTYYNILVQYGIEELVRECADIGIRGLIVPDAYPEESGTYMNACREYQVLNRVHCFANTPVAVGFGIQNAEDVAFLQGKCDIAIIGTQLLNVLERDGLPGVERFLKSVSL
ncbi:tryptophan synthase subunit alpha [Cohnella cholangitidis]|uniref:tryptophan synthase n=1 Tax=Cohnella cholangitidis TaxID=2598458 RepID=A0A7G5BWC1_9BACL|nr:tryptophan synthase subunit alpha [Cohnella cholangitidis]QMV41255.1 hypothetical protein FPL14_08650 [Cohnella cholangitidis]